MDQANARLLELRIQWMNFADAFAKKNIPTPPPCLSTPAHQYAPQATNALEKLGAFYKFVASTDVDIWDDKIFAETFLDQIGIRYPHTFMNLVERDDILEMYDFNNIQIFRNMNFMKICGYSLDDIAVHEWPVLYERSQVITNEIEKQIGYAIDKGIIAKLDVPTHYMKERFSSTRQVVKVDLRFVSPIYDFNHEPAGFAVCCKASIVEENPERHEVRFI